MKIKGILLFLSAAMLCLASCSESPKPTTVVDNSSAAATTSEADSYSDSTNSYYDSTPISQAYLTGDTSSLDESRLKYTTKPFQPLKNLLPLT